MRKLTSMLLVFGLILTMLLGNIGGALAETTDISWFLVTGVVPSSWDQSQYVMRTITEKTGVTVSATTPADDADTKLNLMLVNGKLPDIVTLTNETLIKELIEADLVWDMQEFFETYMPDSHLINGGFPEDIKAALQARDGGWYSLPSHILSPENRTIWGLNPKTEKLWLSTDYREGRGVIFNKNIMDELGITEEDVQTESGLLAALEIVKNANLTVDGMSVYPMLADGSNFNGSNWKSDHGALGALTWMFGGMPVDENGNWFTLYRTAEFKHALRFLNTCAEKGYIDANQFTFDRAAREAACRAGRVFCFLGHTSDTGFYDKANNGFEFYTPGVILSDNGEKPVLAKDGTIGRGWLQNFVSKDTKNPEAVAKFLDYMTSEEGLMLWNYGEPGVDSEWTADGLIKRTEEGSKKANNAAVTGVGAFWAFCNQNFDQKFMDPSVDYGIEPQCAFGANPATQKYDSAAFDNLPGGYLESNTDMLAVSNEVKTFAGTELANIILTATEEDFDARYDAFLAQLDALRLPELEAYINEAVQQNYETMGV
ncbi:MAG: extracellular solute-binding protein, partial [Eubacteriales bacterium]|nr:extracellular solute-binding protein [Eubacteriales bacterium]